MIGFFSMLACVSDEPPPSAFRAAGPDLIVIALDTVRWDHTSLSGYPHDTTPTLSQLAAMPGAVSFTRAYTASAWSLMAYASLFTGRDARSHGLGFSRRVLAGEHTTLAEVLSAHGYQTAAFTSGPYLAPTSGLTRGFDTHRHEQDFVPLTPQIEPSIAWLAASRLEEAPYFLFVQGYDAHPPYTSPTFFSEMYLSDDDGSTLHHGRVNRTQDCRVIGTRSCVSTIGTMQRQKGEDADLSAEHPHIIGHYDSAIRNGDYNLGRLLAGIEQQGALNEAIIVVLSDHGKSFAESRYPDETSQAEQLYHVPLVIRRPSDAPAAQWDGVVSLTDILPTLLEDLKIDPPAGATGESLLTVIVDPATAPDPDKAAVSTELCCDGVQTAGWELYGKRLVPAEWDPTGDTMPTWGPTQWTLYRTGTRVDVADEHPEVVEALRRAIRPHDQASEPDAEESP